MIDALHGIARWLYATAGIMLLSALVRYQLIEPFSWSEWCVASPWEGWCALRSLVIELIQQQRIGWLATIAGMLAILTGWSWAAGSALLCGAFAVVLYAVEPGAFGGLLGLLLLLRKSDDGGHKADPQITSANTENVNA